MKNTVTIKRNHEFQRLYTKGKSAASPYLALYCRKGWGNRNRLGLTVGKKVGGAVVRNRVRRRLREIYRLHEGEIKPGYDLVVVARVRAVYGSYRQLDKSFLALADKLGLLERGDRG